MDTMHAPAITDSSLAVLIGDSLPSSAACQAAVGLLCAARDSGASRDALWRLADIAVWDGLSAARVVLATAAQATQQPTTDSDRIAFELDEGDEHPTGYTPLHGQLTLSL